MSNTQNSSARPILNADQQLDQVRKIQTQIEAAQIKACWDEVQKVLIKHCCKLGYIEVYQNGRLVRSETTVEKDPELEKQKKLAEQAQG